MWRYDRAHLAQAGRQLPRAQKAARVPIGRVVRRELWQVPVLTILVLLQVLRNPQCKRKSNRLGSTA